MLLVLLTLVGARRQCRLYGLLLLLVHWLGNTATLLFSTLYLETRSLWYRPGTLAVFVRLVDTVRFRLEALAFTRTLQVMAPSSIDSR